MAVERNSSLSDGLSALLSSQSDMEVVAIASDHHEARKCFLECNPDLTIIDVDVSNHNGLLTIRELRNLRPDAVMIALVSYEWDATALEAVGAGARAFLPRDEIAKKLLPLIRSI